MNDAVATYRMLEVASGLKVGDKVRITRRARDFEKGWDNTWENSMDKSIGRIGIISYISSTGVHLIEIDFSYPIFVLEKVTE